jgi:hypothetical protein
MFVFDFILHTAYTVDACALTSIMPSLSLIDTIYCTPDTKATPASASIFRLICISLLHNIVKRVLIELRDSVVFSVVQKVMEFERIG